MVVPYDAPERIASRQASLAYLLAYDAVISGNSSVAGRANELLRKAEKYASIAGGEAVERCASLRDLLRRSPLSIKNSNVVFR